MNFINIFHNVEIKRELRYCAAFNCKTIHFIPQDRGWFGSCSPSWSFCPVSGCCIYGPLNKHGQFTGDDIAWVYPDNKTALLGSFEDGKMIEASPAVVTHKTVSAKGLLSLKLAKLPGEKLVFSPSTAIEMGNQGDIRDAYEHSMVYLAPSLIPGADEGLFARKDYPTNTLVSFYHGLNVPYDIEDFTNELYAFDEDAKVMKNVYKIKIDSNTTYYIDLPLEVGRDTTLYQASLGHKVNHSFIANCRYRQMQHPRWGEIVGIFTTKHVRQQEEFLCNYGYDIDKHLVPLWYKKAWEKHHNKNCSTNKQG